jgi:hypothetical protein
LLRSAVILLRLLAFAAVRGDAGADLALVRERLTEATDALSKFAAIRKNAGAILKSAKAIDLDADALETTLHRLLIQASTALEGVGSGDQPAASLDTDDVA